ncbi:MAG: hypothetical protein HYV09_14925 [Deltaproteobacteria bacterium]|nr:hypothetical protein [Deltaproteobacteria bacterium]
MRAFDKASGAVRVLTTDALGETTSAPMLTEDHVFWVFDNVRASGGRLAMLMSLRRNGLGTPKVVVPRTDVATRNVLFDAGDVYISSSGDYGVFRVRPASRTFVALYETLEREGGIHSLATTRDRVFWTLAHEEWSAGVTTRQLSLVAAPKSGSARPITMIRHVTAGGWPALVGADDQLYACTQSEVLRLVESPPPARFERVLDAPNLDACGILADGIVWQVGDSVFGVARGR